MVQIQDGAGSGVNAEVDSNQRLHTDAVTFSRAELEVELGNAYNINTGTIALTSASKSSVLYVKNNENEPLVIESLIYLLGSSTGGTGECVITVIRNPTAGTIVSNAVDCEMAGVNRDFGSNQTLNADMYKGAEGDTITASDGKAIESILPIAQRHRLGGVGDIVLEKGSSIGIEITPPPGNTGMNAQFAMSVFVDTLKDA